MRELRQQVPFQAETTQKNTIKLESGCFSQEWTGVDQIRQSYGTWSSQEKGRRGVSPHDLV